VCGLSPARFEGSARVSSHDQRSDLDRQVARLMAWATSNGYEVGEAAREVGSGLNGKRPKLRRILSDPSATVAVMKHRDRLARFGVEHLKAAPGAHGRRIVVADSSETTDDLVRGMIEVLTSMCARLYGRRDARIGRCARSLPPRRTGTGGLMAKMGELKRTAQTVGVTSSTLRQHGWKTASPARVQAVMNDPPEGLTAARENQRKKFAKQQRRRAQRGAASRLD
jgi:putative resolvase